MNRRAQRVQIRGGVAPPEVGYAETPAGSLHGVHEGANLFDVVTDVGDIGDPRDGDRQSSPPRFRH